MNVLPRLSGVRYFWRILASLLLALLMGVILPKPVSGLSHVVISGVSPGVSSASEEYIQIANIGDEPVDITGYSLKYSRKIADTRITKILFEPPQNIRYILPPDKRAIFVSNDLFYDSLSDNPSFVADGLLLEENKNLVGTGGVLELVDDEGQTIDTVLWGDMTTPPTKALTTGSSLALNQDNVLEYINGIDFPLEFGGIVEQETVRDLCPTLEELQITLPDGYGYDEAGNCELLTLDICPNIDLIQTELQSGYVLDDIGQCLDASLDVCPILEGFQYELPVGHRFVGLECMVIPIMQPLKLSEVLPNAAGVDDGKEFIEIFHPGVESVDLADYYLKIGKNAEKQYAIPSKQLLPGGYMALWDSELGFSLLNTTTRVELYFYDATLVDEIIPYQSPKDDISWALIDDMWQFTNSVTPGSKNIASVEEFETESPQLESAALGPCPEGKYRHPLTNRCRTIESDASVLAACDADEYRNPDTNRCRKITQAFAGLEPCEVGYERNPETNRCRKAVASADDLVPCKEGYERNPETNRCRKIVGATLSPQADIEELLENESSARGVVSPYALAAVAGVGALGYGTYEWRTELVSFGQRAIRLLRRK